MHALLSCVKQLYRVVWEIRTARLGVVDRLYYLTPVSCSRKQRRGATFGWSRQLAAWT